MVQVLSSAARVAFMIGHPVAHTAMPERLNAVMVGQNHAMIPLDIPPGSLPQMISALRGIENVDGWVITAPHKQVMATLVDQHTSDAVATGSVNLVWKSDGILWGDNSDGAGFCAALQEKKIDINHCSVLIFGAGGAGTAIAHALASRGVAAIDVYDPNSKRAAALGAISTSITFPASVAAYDLIINATAIGLDGETLVHDLSGLRPGAIVADVLALENMSPFLRKAQSYGAHLQTGQEMAFAQIPIALSRFGWRTRIA